MAEVNRVSTIGIHRRTIDDINRVQFAMSEAQRKITTGLKASTFGELGGDVTKVVGLESSLKSAGRFINSNEVVITRLKTMDLAVEKIQEVASNLASQLALERSSSANLNNMTEFAKASLTQVEEALNTQQNGRYLFSGGKTNIRSVAVDLANASSVVNGSPTANYYGGDDLTFSTQASSQLSIEYGIKGNDVAFQNVIGALHKAITGEAGSTTDLEEAVTLVNQAVSDLARVRSQINTDVITLNDINTQHKKVEIELKNVIDKTVGADVVEASIDVSLNEAILTATLQTFARISRLTLSDYLR